MALWRLNLLPVVQKTALSLKFDAIYRNAEHLVIVSVKTTAGGCRYGIIGKWGCPTGLLEPSFRQEQTNPAEPLLITLLVTLLVMLLVARCVKAVQCNPRVSVTPYL